MKKQLRLLLFICLGATQLWAQSTAQWTQTQGPQGGQVYDLLRIDSMVIAATSNGLWKSTDEGLTWQILNESTRGKVVPVVEMFDGELMWIVSYYNPYPLAVVNFALLFKSTDLGATFTWNHLGDFGGYIAGSHRFGPLHLSKQGDTLYLLDYFNQLLMSPDEGITWNRTDTDRFASNNESVAINGHRIIVYDYIYVYRSEDGGNTWTETQDSFYHTSMFFYQNVLIRISSGFIHVSQDFGITWQSQPFTLFDDLTGVVRHDDGSFSKFDGYYYHSADGLNWQQITTAGGQQPVTLGIRSGTGFIAAGSSGFFKTTANNTAFEAANEGFIATLIHSIATTGSGRVIASSNIGEYRKNSTNNNWSNLNSAALDSAAFDYFTSMASTGDTTWGLSTDDNLYRIIEGNSTWEYVISTDSINSNFELVKTIENDIYLIEDKQVRRSTDGGTTWQLFLPENTDYQYRDIIKHNDYLIYVTSTNEIFRSDNDGQSWQFVYDAPNFGWNEKRRLGSLAGRIFLWDNARIYYSDDEGISWQKSPLDGAPLTQVSENYFFNTLDVLCYKSMIFAVIPIAGVYVSYDLGDSWEPFNNGLSGAKGTCITAHDDRIYLGTLDDGVWQLEADFEIYGGKIYQDQNQNNQQDPDESPLSQVRVAAEPLGSYTVSTTNGGFSLIAASNLDTIRAYFPSPYAVISPAYHLAQQPGSGHDFGIYLPPNVYDLRADVTNWAVFRPGFGNTLTCTLENIGTEPIANASVRYIIPQHLSIDQIIPSQGTSVVGDTIIWQVSNLALFEKRAITVSVTLSANAMIGDILTIQAYAPYTNDANPADNSFTLTTMVAGAYDPNDKTAATTITPEQIATGDPIEYIIRFENTGNFYAEKVVITDHLETNLNPATVQLIASSHFCYWRLKSGGELEFTFDNIGLEPQETGFVKFSVEANRTLELNDQIANTAKIYFDFNAPIITNTVKTTVSTVSATDLHAAKPYRITMSPNPTKGIIHVNLPDAALVLATRLEVTDAQGQVLKSEPLSGTRQIIDLSKYAAGYYQVTLRDASGGILASERAIVVR
jgi:uncharacterized repeat protein (TIGR01451 family)